MTTFSQTDQNLTDNWELYKQMMKQSPASHTSTTMARQMVLWLLMISICLLFGAITAAFVRATPKVSLSIPPIFYVNILVLILSSVALHVSLMKREAHLSVTLLKATLVLGLLFLAGQAWGWVEIASQQVASVQTDYLYVLTGLHAVHLVAGLIFLLYIYHPSARKKLRTYEMATYFWHFLGALWVYLLIVLQMYAG